MTLHAAVGKYLEIRKECADKLGKVPSAQYRDLVGAMEESLEEVRRQHQALSQGEPEVPGVDREISAWQEETFPEQTSLGVANHLLKEAAEIVEEIGRNAELASAPGGLAQDPDGPVAFELADAHFLLLRLRTLARITPRAFQTVLRKKLAINRERRWARAADGSYQHVRA